MTKEIAISVKDLHKSFRLPKEHSSELKHAFINFVRGIKGYKEQKVLRGISFDIEKGDFIGIVGRNGSGKSTLLKILAGVYEPDHGSVQINGSLVPFIELGVGFNPELTGRENIYMNGAMLGFSNEDVDQMYDEIVDFAELHEFMDQKLKNYSSGMQVRLAFSIAIRAESDILLLDEVLAVGDEAFQRKCFQYFAKLRREKKTVILVTHSMDQVQQFCNKAILIQNGKITESGSPAIVAQAYRELNIVKVSKSIEYNSDTNDNITINSRYSNKNGSLEFDINVKSTQPLHDVALLFEIVRDTGEIVYRIATDERLGAKIDELRSDENMNVKIVIQNIFPNGIFDGIVRLFTGVGEITIKNRKIQFEIANSDLSKHDILWKPNDNVDVRIGTS